MFLTFSKANAALISHWRFDETAGGTAVDSDGSNNGTIDGADINQTGRIGGAYDFVEANTDTVSIANDASLSPNSITLSAWIQTTDTDTSQIIARDDNSSRQFQFRMNSSGRVAFIPFFSGSASTGHSSSTAVNDGDWHHVAATYNSGTGALNIYIDGTSDYSTTIAGSPNLDAETSIMYIGRAQNADPAWFNGLMDDVRFYSDARNSTRIADIANFRYRWNAGGTTGNWSTGTNWRNSADMNHQDANFYFDNSSSTGDVTITVDSNVTAGSINFNDADDVTLQSNSITLDVSSGSASIDVDSTSGSDDHAISSDITFSDNTTITNDSTGTLTLSGTLSGSTKITKNGSGTVSVTGAMNNTGDIVVSGGTFARAAGTGDSDLFIAEGTGATQNVTVQSGGDVTVANSLLMSGTTTSAATMVIDGDGSSVTVANLSDIGRDGTATLTIQNGGDFIHQGGSNFRLGAGLSATGDGLVTVSGNGSTLDIQGSTADLIVGNSGGNGTLVVSNSATVTVGDIIRIGDDAGATGQITIQSGGDVSASDVMHVGNSGTGSLRIDGSGSTFTGTTVNIGNNAGSVGTLTLSNGGTIDATTVNLNQTGSTFTADTIAIGNAVAEIDTLNINAGTTATATTIDIGSGGTLNLNRSDGIIGASDMNLSGGTFDTNGNDQASGGLGALTMTANSVIDVGSGAVINWAVLDETNWTGTLEIHNWSSGKHNASGSDRLIFADYDGFFHHTHGLQIKFYSDAGSTLVGSSGYFIGNNLVAAPEPSSYVGMSALFAFVILIESRRRKQKSEQVTKGGSGE